MSLTNAVMEILNKHLSSFFEVIIEKYSMDTTPSELFSILENGKNAVDTSPVKKVKKEKTTVVKEPTESEPLTKAKIAKCSVAELKLLCKERSLKLSGKKDELVARLLETLDNGTITTEKNEKPQKSKAKNEKVVIQKIEKEQTPTAIRRNKFNNYEHPPTRLVFRSETKKAYGKQSDDGEIISLTDDDIELCKQYKFEYELPENLDMDTDINTIKIKELEDDDDEIIVEEQESDAEEVEEEESEVEIDDE